MPFSLRRCVKSTLHTTWEFGSQQQGSWVGFSTPFCGILGTSESHLLHWWAWTAGGPVTYIDSVLGMKMCLWLRHNYFIYWIITIFKSAEKILLFYQATREYFKLPYPWVCSDFIPSKVLPFGCEDTFHI